MAERTGLEPATSGVTGQHSNQLNYRSAKPESLMAFPALCNTNIVKYLSDIAMLVLEGGGR